MTTQKIPLLRPNGALAGVPGLPALGGKVGRSVRSVGGGLLRAKILYLAVARHKRRFKRADSVGLPWLRLGPQVRMGRKPLNSRMGKGAGALFSTKRQYGPGLVLLAWRRIGPGPARAAAHYLRFRLPRGAYAQA